MKKFLSVFFILILLISTPVQTFASEGLKLKAVMCTNFNPECDINNKIEFMPLCDFEYKNHSFSQNSKISAIVEYSQKEKRLHKSGYAEFKIINYTDKNGECIDLSKENIKGIARKYDKIDKKEATKTGAELTATTAAGFILPGVDIVYYFTKGTIKNDNGNTRFKSGVHTAYENSIFWFFLKGKPIVLSKNDMISIILYTDDVADETN